MGLGTFVAGRELRVAPGQLAQGDARGGSASSFDLPRLSVCLGELAFELSDVLPQAIELHQRDGVLRQPHGGLHREVPPLVAMRSQERGLRAKPHEPCAVTPESEGLLDFRGHLVLVAVRGALVQDAEPLVEFERRKCHRRAGLESTSHRDPCVDLTGRGETKALDDDAWGHEEGRVARRASPNASTVGAFLGGGRCGTQQNENEAGQNSREHRLFARRLSHGAPFVRGLPKRAGTYLSALAAQAKFWCR